MTKSNKPYHTTPRLDPIIQANKYAVIWSQNVHFVTTLPVPSIKKLLLQNLLI